MPLGDLLGLLVETLKTQRLRAFLTMLGIVIGMGAVVMLSSIGEGARAGIMAQFSQFGTTIIAVNPGREQTAGAGPGVMGGTTHPLTVEDMEALRRVPGVRVASAAVFGNGLVEGGGRSRYTYIVGTVPEDAEVLQWTARVGTHLPPGDIDSMPAVVVLGSKVATELFPGTNPLGQHLRAGERRFTIVGIMSSKGQILGFDMDDMVIIPIRHAIQMFNREDVTEIRVVAASHAMIDRVAESVKSTLMDRHDGEEDFTITTQKDMLEVIDEVLKVLTVGVLAIAGISVFVGAMGILTIMWVTVHERTQEIGLIKAIGASNRQVILIFLAESGALSLMGGAAGVLGALGAGWLLRRAFPGFWIETPLWIIPITLGVSLGVGVLAGVAPALRAARLDPVAALRAE